LVVVDVSDPKNVKALTAFSEVSDAQRVVAAGPRVYLLEPGLTILDVADPAQPKKLDELGAQRQTYDLGLWKDYVVTLTSLGLQVLDLRDLEKVRRVAQYETGTPSPPPTGSASEAVEASATTPAAETLVSQTAGRSAEAAKKAAAASGKASTSPARSGESAAPPTAPKPPAQNRRVALYGHYAYIARAGEGLWIVDVEGQEDLKRVGAVTDLGTVECCAISGQSALVGNQEGGITILDLKDPQEPKVLGRFEVQGK
jgi:hypothetical protein